MRYQRMDKSEITVELEILSGLRSGSQRERAAAIRRLCTPEWEGLARRAVRSAGGRDADLEDIFQESLAALVKNVMIGRFQENSKLSTYFYEICRRRCLKAYRKKEFAELTEAMIGDVTPSLENLLIDREVREERKQLLNRIIEGLGEPCASILKFRKLEYSNEEIAEQLNRSADTIKNQSSRCRKRMREIIESNPELLKKMRSRL